jgi:hypothetical protein
MHFGAQLASVVFAALVFLLVLEMVRRRHLHERYAILWLGAAFALLVLAVWTGLLRAISDLVGIKTPSNAFFVVAFGFLLLLVLHFSSVVSRLLDETRVLAQRLALVEERLDPDKAVHRSAAQHDGSLRDDLATPAAASAERTRARSTS